MTGDGGLIEVQATAERTPLSRAHLDDAARARRARGSTSCRPRRSARSPRAAREARPRDPQRAQGCASSRALLDGTTSLPLPDDVELPPETGDDVRRERAAQGARRGRGDRRSSPIADDSGIEAAALGGAPGVRSARFAGEDATDEENLGSCSPRRPPGSALRLRLRRSRSSIRAPARSALRGPLHRDHGRRAARRRAASATTRSSSPTIATTGRTMAELTPAEKDAISHRGRAARALLSHLRERAPATR